MKKIREIIPNSTNDELREIILEDRSAANTVQEPGTRYRAMAYLDSILPTGSRPRKMESLESVECVGRAECSERASPFPPPSSMSAPHLMRDVSPAESSPSPASVSWERFVIDDGIEIHIRSDRKDTLRKGELRRIFDRLSKHFKS
jgi:hypothetical protein